VIECKHEWEVDDFGFEGYHYRCKKCGTDEISPSEIAHCLNATQELSAEDARRIARDIENDWGDTPMGQKLQAYADVLEGK
jgi:hypothetical protein